MAEGSTYVQLIYMALPIFYCIGYCINCRQHKHEWKAQPGIDRLPFRVAKINDYPFVGDSWLLPCHEGGGGGG